MGNPRMSQDEHAQRGSTCAGLIDLLVQRTLLLIDLHHNLQRPASRSVFA
jgi:hypothetical protein